MYTVNQLTLQARYTKLVSPCKLDLVQPSKQATSSKVLSELPCSWASHNARLVCLAVHDMPHFTVSRHRLVVILRMCNSLSYRVVQDILQS